MTDDSTVSRRRVLRTVGIGTAVALAGCSGDGNGSDDGDSGSAESATRGGSGSEESTPETGDGTEDDTETSEPIAGEFGGWQMKGADAGNSRYLSDWSGPETRPEERWRTEFDIVNENGAIGLAVADGSVYATSIQRLLALNAADGSRQWEFGQPEPGRQNFPRQSVAINRGQVYVGRQKNRGGTDVYALNADDGSEIWQFSVGRLGRGGILLANDALIIGSYRNSEPGISVRNVNDGSIRWRITDALGPLINDNSVIVQRNMKLQALTLANGEKQWETSLQNNIFPHSTRDNLIITTRRSEEVEVVAFGTDGTEQYSTVIPAFPQSAALADGRFFMSTENEVVSVTSDGNINWQNEIASQSGASLRVPIAVVGDTVYAVSTVTAYQGENDGQLYALSRADGSVRWQRHIQHRPRRIVVTGGTVFILQFEETGENRSRVWVSAYTD